MADIPYTRYLDEAGQLQAPVPALAKNPEELIALYRNMRLTRLFDSRAVALQRTGQLGTYASCLGQEAIGTGIAHAMEARDLLVPAYREYAAQFMRGVSMAEILLYWGGDERGMDYAAQREDFPIAVPIGSQACHAVGVAQAFRYRQQERVAVCVLGDGATSKGDFYESLNIAGAWQLPVLFVICNNQWAISLHRSAQTRAETLAQKGVAAGVPGEQVDGNDLFAVSSVSRRLIERARAGEGPAILEALTYRLSDHTTADDASRYRDPGEVTRMQRAEPLRRLQSYLTGEGHWSDAREEALRDECNRLIDEAVTRYLETPPQAPASMFDYLYQELPGSYRRQREELEP